MLTVYGAAANAEGLLGWCSLQAAEDPKKKAASIKNVWATLKQLKVGPQDHTFGPEERQVVEELLSGSRNVHERQRQGFEAAWAVFNRCCPFTACQPHCPHAWSKTCLLTVQQQTSRSNGCILF